MRRRDTSRRGKAAFALLLLIFLALMAFMDIAFNDPPVLPALLSKTTGMDAEGYYTEYDAHIGTPLISLSTRAPDDEERFAGAPEREAERDDTRFAPVKPAKPAPAK